MQTAHERSRAVDQATHNKIVSFIWGIADDVLRDLFRRGKYPDGILAIEKEAEGLLDGLLVEATQP